jgi:hypothetical protein
MRNQKKLGSPGRRATGESDSKNFQQFPITAKKSKDYKFLRSIFYYFRASLLMDLTCQTCPAEKKAIMEFKGSRTEKNLLATFAGESQARTRYSFFSGAAKQEGFEQISAIFSETSENEKEHAKLFFTFLKGGDAEITATYGKGGGIS